MNEINDEIRQTINLMQTVNDECVYSAMQKHLKGLLEIKRNELQRRLVECKLGYVVCDKPKPLSTEELKVGGWWCSDVSKDCAKVFESKGLRVINLFDWGSGADLIGCGLDDSGSVTRCIFEFIDEKQICRLGNEFYWSEK